MRDMHKVSRRVPSWVWSLFHGCSYGGYCRYVARLTSFCAPLLAQACHLDHLITAKSLSLDKIVMSITVHLSIVIDTGGQSYIR